MQSADLPKTAWILIDLRSNSHCYHSDHERKVVVAEPTTDSRVFHVSRVVLGLRTLQPVIWPGKKHSFSDQKFELYALSLQGC